MNRKIVEYQMNTFQNSRQTQHSVNVLIKEGWQPYGPVIDMENPPAQKENRRFNEPLKEESMYDLINKDVIQLLKRIPQSHVSDYDWLMQNLGSVNSTSYQKMYRKYWGMNAARLASGYYAAYFQELVGGKKHNTDHLRGTGGSYDPLCLY